MQHNITGGVVGTVVIISSFLSCLLTVLIQVL